MQHSCIIIKQLCNSILLKTGQSWAGIPISQTLDRWWAAYKYSFFFFFKHWCHACSWSRCVILFSFAFCGGEHFHWSQIYKHNNHTSLKQIWMLSRTSVNSSSWALLPNRTWTKREDTRRGVIYVTVINDYEDVVLIVTIVWHQPWGQFRPGLAATVRNGEMHNKMWGEHEENLSGHSWRDGAYLSDELPLSAHEGDAVLHRQVQSPLDGLLQREIKVEPAEKERLFHFKSLPPLPHHQAVSSAFSCLSLNSGLRSLFLVAVLLLVVPFLSGSRMKET